MDNIITWQAYWCARVNRECLATGKLPSGSRMNRKDKIESEREIKDGEAILLQYGCAEQGKLFA